MSQRKVWLALRTPLTMLSLLAFVLIVGNWGLKQTLTPIPQRPPEPCVVQTAPLDRIQADFMQVTVPTGSRLNGVTVQELRLPSLTVVATIIREGAALPVDGATRIRAGDELLIVTPSRDRQKVEERFTRVSANGRLASWLDRT